MSTGYTYRDHIVEKLNQAAGLLHVPLDPDDTLAIADFIHQAMTGPWRFFHRPEHIFDVSGQDEPIEILAALFHDVAYLHVDMGVSLNLSAHLSAYVRERGDRIYLREKYELNLTENKAFALVLDLFDNRPGQLLDVRDGMNEFLSAIAAASVLSPFFDLSVLARIVACIELTIPFRPPTDSGQTRPEILYQRLGRVNAVYDMGLSDREIHQTVVSAVQMANRDVAGFGSEDPVVFLDNTWSLMPETNHFLATPEIYTPRQYRQVLQKMYGFINFLKPELVFQQFAGLPDDKVLQHVSRRCEFNLEIGRRYFEAKLVSIMVLEALASRIDPSLPLSIMMGRIEEAGKASVSFTDFLAPPDTAYPPETETEEKAYVYLAKGRSRDVDFDLKHSPLAAYMVRWLGFANIRNLLDKAAGCFDEVDHIDAEKFLALCDPALVRQVRRALIQLFERRIQNF